MADEKNVIHEKCRELRNRHGVAVVKRAEAAALLGAAKKEMEESASEIRKLQLLCEHERDSLGFCKHCLLMLPEPPRPEETVGSAKLWEMG
jgi:hypothetical protein